MPLFGQQGHTASWQSDAHLIARTRRGDMGAYAELWQRHQSAAVSVAGAFTSSIDSEDLVSEAYAQILVVLQRGGGPNHSAFRPYLYTVIRNLARRWGAAQREVTVDELPESSDDSDTLDAQLDSLDQGMVRQAFRSLPPRWQEVLWYTEVEQTPPAEIAQLLGIGANGVSALAYRAREGLRQQWLQGHVTDVLKKGECAWALDRMGEYSRSRLTKRNTARMEKHLDGCSSCLDVSLEVNTISDQLAGALIPAVLAGSAVGGGVVTFSQAGGAAVAAGAGLSTAGGITSGGAMAIGATSVVALLGLFGGVGLSPVEGGSGHDRDGPPQSEIVIDDPVGHVSTFGEENTPKMPESRPGTGEGGDGSEKSSAKPHVDDLINGATDKVGGLVDTLTDGAVSVDVDTSLAVDSAGVDVGVGVGDADLDVGLDVGDGSVDAEVGVGGILDIEISTGADSGLLGISLFGSSSN